MPKKDHYLCTLIFFMIQHNIQDNHVHIFIPKTDFSYRIPKEKIASISTWKIGKPENDEQIVIQNVSKWALKLFTKNITQENYIAAFKALLDENFVPNNIDWKATLLAIKVQNRYNWLSANNSDETEILIAVKEKYQLDY